MYTNFLCGELPKNKQPMSQPITCKVYDWSACSQAHSTVYLAVMQIWLTIDKYRKQCNLISQKVLMGASGFHNSMISGWWRHNNASIASWATSGIDCWCTRDTSPLISSSVLLWTSCPAFPGFCKYRKLKLFHRVHGSYKPLISKNHCDNIWKKRKYASASARTCLSLFEVKELKCSTQQRHTSHNRLNMSAVTGNSLIQL